MAKSTPAHAWKRPKSIHIVQFHFHIKIVQTFTWELLHDVVQARAEKLRRLIEKPLSSPVSSTLCPLSPIHTVDTKEESKHSKQKNANDRVPTSIVTTVSITRETPPREPPRKHKLVIQTELQARQPLTPLRSVQSSRSKPEQKQNCLPCSLILFLLL